jgi:hypothetical protein
MLGLFQIPSKEVLDVFSRTLGFLLRHFLYLCEILTFPLNGFQRVPSNASWEQAMKMIINDPRYR